MENRKLTLGSLFSGSGGFELGGILAGIEPRWASEIEPFCVRVTTKRLPQVRHLGDIKAIDGGKIEPVDIVTFGSPCTNLSIAGKRAGLHGEQSSLFFEAIRVIKEMRCATHGIYPRFIVWENVVGAFSSSQGRDLQSVLTEIVRVKEPEAPEVPMPEKGGWPLADVLLGDGWSVAYRTLDAQYFGVAQRRRRIYLVADFDGGCAGKVLFESEGVSGYSSSRFRAWQDAARAASDCAHATGGHLRLCLNDQGGSRMDVTEDRTNTLRAQSEHPPLVFSNHSQDSRYTGPTEKSEALTSMLGTGGNSTPLVVNESKYWDGGDVAGTLTANGAGGRQRMPDKGNFQCVVQNRNKRGKGIVAAVDVRITTEKSKLVRRNVHETEVARCLDTDGARPDANQGGLAIVERSSYAVTTGAYTQAEKEKSPTLMARDYKFPHAVCRGIGRDVMNAGANADHDGAGARRGAAGIHRAPPHAAGMRPAPRIPARLVRESRYGKPDRRGDGVLAGCVRDAQESDGRVEKAEDGQPNPQMSEESVHGRGRVPYVGKRGRAPVLLVRAFGHRILRGTKINPEKQQKTLAIPAF